MFVSIRFIIRKSLTRAFFVCIDARLMYVIFTLLKIAPFRPDESTDGDLQHALVANGAKWDLSP